MSKIEEQSRNADGGRPLPRRLCARCGRRTSWCRACGHRSYCYFCNSCSVHGQDEPTAEMIRQPDQERRPLWVVQVAFLTRRGWSESFEVRVRARGMAGAIWQGVREARRAHLKPRTRVRQGRVSAVRA